MRGANAADAVPEGERRKHIQRSGFPAVLLLRGGSTVGNRKEAKIGYDHERKISPRTAGAGRADLPAGGLDVLSRAEVARLRDASAGGMHELLRRCALAVLTSGSASDDPRARDLYPDFDIQVAQQDRGVRIDLVNAPAMAFVGEIIRGVAELLFAVVRDLAYMAIEMGPAYAAELESSEGITNAVFGLLRNARILNPGDPNLVVCWAPLDLAR